MLLLCVVHGFHFGFLCSRIGLLLYEVKFSFFFYSAFGTTFNSGLYFVVSNDLKYFFLSAVKRAISAGY